MVEFYKTKGVVVSCGVVVSSDENRKNGWILFGKKRGFINEFIKHGYIRKYDINKFIRIRYNWKDSGFR